MWKETVMSDEQAIEIIHRCKGTVKDARREVNIAQAQITGDIAYKKGFTDAAGIATQQAYETGIDVGRKKGEKEGARRVVEWIKEFSIHGSKASIIELLEIMRVHSEFGFILKELEEGEE